MIGFFIGTACLIGFFATLRRARYAHAMGHGCYGDGFGFGGGGYGHHGRGGFGEGFHREEREGHRRGGFERGPFGGRGGGRGFDVLRGAFRELDTTPGQEKVMREAATGLWGRGREAKAALKDARKGFAQAVRQESFDEVALGEATAKLEEATDAMRKAIIDAVAKVHGVLDERQRNQLADFIESGGPGFGDGHRGFGGPYRSHGDETPRAPWEV